MASALIGGPDLRARLNAIGQIPPAYAGIWAEDAAGKIRTSAPPSKAPESKVFTTKASATRGAVYGAYWWIFVDRGTKAHDITPRKAKMLRWERGGETIFASKSHHKRIARRPFITKAAQDALGGEAWVDEVVQTWNHKRLRKKHAFL